MLPVVILALACALTLAVLGLAGLAILDSRSGRRRSTLKEFS